MSCHFRSFLSFLGFCFIVTRRLVRSLFYRHPWLFFCNEFLHSFTFCWSVALLSLMTVKTSSSVERALISSSPSLQQLRNCKKKHLFLHFSFSLFLHSTRELVFVESVVSLQWNMWQWDVNSITCLWQPRSSLWWGRLCWCGRYVKILLRTGLHRSVRLNYLITPLTEKNTCLSKNSI